MEKRGTSHLQQKPHSPYRSRGWGGREEAGPTSDMDARKSCSGLKMVYKSNPYLLPQPLINSFAHLPHTHALLIHCSTAPPATTVLAQSEDFRPTTQASR